MFLYNVFQYNSMSYSCWLKEFDMRQNEKEMKFIRVGGAVRTAAAQGGTNVEQESLSMFFV